MNTLVKILFGSHLYGTDTENSDTDFKGIFLPTKEDAYLNRITNTLHKNTNNSGEKNSSDDVDYEIFSLQYFIKLACDGETVALDMLHAPSKNCLITSDIWKELQYNKDKFYTKNLKAFVGYCKKQAAKYGIKGSRLNDCKKVLDFCESQSKYTRLKEVFNLLPTGEHIEFVNTTNEGCNRFYSVCGKLIGETSTVEYLQNVLNSFYNKYGHRARLASINENVDWKAVSHAFRAAYQVKEILTEGTITFPLKKASFIKEIKGGIFDFNSYISPMLEDLIAEVEELSKISKLPETVDKEYWNKFIIECYNQ